MPRDISGTYTLPLAPIEPRRIPVVNWVNPTVEDIEAALNNIPGGALAPGTVDTAQLADNSVTNAKMADNAVRPPEVNGMSSNGFTVRTSAATFTPRSITTPNAGLSTTNGDGVAGNVSITPSDDLAALEALASTGLAVRSGTNTWLQRSIAAGAGGGVVVTNGNGVAGNPTVNIYDSGNQSLTLVNSFVQGVSTPLIVRRIGDVVFLWGNVTRSAAPAFGTTITTLPVGYRPVRGVSSVTDYGQTTPLLFSSSAFAISTSGVVTTGATPGAGTGHNYTVCACFPVA